MTVPDRSWFDPIAGATMHTGFNAVEAGRSMLPGRPMAADIETPGLNTFTINCITCAWTDLQGNTHSILLDPNERGHGELFTDMMARCGSVIFHNAAFDVPILWHSKLIDRSGIEKVTDTLITARMAYPDPYIGKSLEKLVKAHLDVNEFSGGMTRAFKAAGYRTQQAGYEGMSIQSPIYRVGAMMDTIMTLKLEPVIRRKAFAWLTDHPFQVGGARTTAEALPLLETQQRVNRVMLRRSAVGLAVDPDYLAKYVDSVDKEKQQAITLLGQHSDAKGPLVGGASKGGRIVEYLASINALPDNWPRSPKTRKLRATKADLDMLDHPLAKAQRSLAQIEKIEQYITKVQVQYETTGRCHPQVAILGASQSGRMSVSGPEYHQFSELARPIISDDGQGLTSIDWSQIEPVTMALMAKDHEFLAPFEAGADLYEPIQRSCGLPGKDGRKIAKVVLLAAMYGQSVRSLAKEINHTPESAAQIRRQMFAAMPECAKWMNKVTGVAESYRRVITVGGRILPVTEEGSYKSVNHTCVTPDTPILTADLRHVPAGSISVGDALVGFDEYSLDPTGGRGKGKRRFRTAHVERVETIRKPGVMVSAGGRTTMCSDDHLWLVRCPERQPRLRWIRADELEVGYHQLLSLGVWETDTSWEAGYLAGLYDGEGHMLCRTTGASHTGLGFAQLPGPVMDRFCATMDKLGLSYGYSPRTPGSTSPTDNVRIHGLAKMMRTVGTLRPERFTSRSREIFDGAELHTTRQMEAVPAVDDVIQIGDIDVMSIATTTRTFVANGFLSHNCQGSAYDILAHTIVRMDEEGLGDHIQLAMHDEVVVDTEVAPEVQRIMEEPPPFLEAWAGRSMKLRTDRNDMGHCWLKV